MSYSEFPNRRACWLKFFRFFSTLLTTSRRTKILTLETTIFGLKMMVKSCLDFFYFEILRAPSEIPANVLGQFSRSVQIFLHWAAATLKGLVGFKNKNF